MLRWPQEGMSFRNVYSATPIFQGKAIIYIYIYIYINFEIKIRTNYDIQDIQVTK